MYTYYYNIHMYVYITCIHILFILYVYMYVYVLTLLLVDCICHLGTFVTVYFLRVGYAVGWNFVAFIIIVIISQLLIAACECSITLHLLESQTVYLSILTER